MLYHSHTLFKQTSVMKGFPVSQHANIFICILHIWRFCRHFCYERTFLLPFWAPRTAAMLVSSLQMKSRKRLGHDVIDICALHAGLLLDVKNTDSESETARHKMAVLTAVFFAALKHHITAYIDWNQRKTAVSLFIYIFFIPFLLIGSLCPLVKQREKMTPLLLYF